MRCILLRVCLVKLELHPPAALFWLDHPDVCEPYHQPSLCPRFVPVECLCLRIGGRLTNQAHIQSVSACHAGNVLVEAWREPAGFPRPLMCGLHTGALISSTVWSDAQTGSMVIFLRIRPRAGRAANPAERSWTTY